MKALAKEKVGDVQEVRCNCNRYLFSIGENKIYIKCRRCKREHEVEIKK